jgi:hypothetical protein
LFGSVFSKASVIPPGHRGPDRAFVNALLAIEQLAHLDVERVAGPRLGDEVEAGVEDAVVDDGVLRVAGHEEHPHAGRSVRRRTASLAVELGGTLQRGSSSMRRTRVLADQSSHEAPALPMR